MVSTITQKSLSNWKYSKFFYLLCCVLCFHLSEAQLVVTNNSNANQLVQNLLGDGLSYSNATLSCPNTASALFTYVPDVSLSFTSGVILSTGRATDISGSASGPTISTDFLNAPADAQLTSIAITGGTGQDACVLQFDFEPLGDTVKFNYVFGSEEYPSWVCSSFNDVFGFLVSGPNPQGGNYSSQNIAVIPGTANVPVAINTVHANANGSNTTTGQCSNYANGNSNYQQYYYNNASSTWIAFNGLTTAFTAMIAVIPCSTYHMKLGIQDMSDGSYDSGVFLQAGSFSSNAVSISANAGSRLGALGNVGNNIGEGCDTGYVTLKIAARLDSSTLHFTIGGTATNGVDYQTIVDSLVFAAGDTVKTIPIITTGDTAVEGNETVKLYLLGQCSPNPIDSITFTIYDAIRMTMQADTTVCRDSSFVLHETVVGTIFGNIYYSWTPSATLSSATVASPVATPQDTTVYILTVRDSISCPVTDSVKISVRDCNGLYLTVDKDTVCLGETVQLHASLFRAGFSQWTPSSGANTVSDATIQDPTAIVTSSQLFRYSVTQLDGTILYDSIMVYIDTTARVVTGTDTTQCTNAIALTSTPFGNQAAPYQYTWTRLSDDTVVATTQNANLTQQTAGAETYIVTLQGGYCTVSDTVTITAYPTSTFAQTINACPIQLPYSWNGQSLTTSGTYSFTTPNAYGCDSTITLTFNVVSTIVDSQTAVICYYTQPFYLWDGQTLTASGIYRDTLTSAAGCDSITILNLSIDSLQFSTPAQTNVLCYGASTGAISSTTAGGTGTAYVWTYNSANYSANSPTNPTNLAAGNYTQIATDANGCKDTATFVITQPSRLQLTLLGIVNVSCNGGSDGQISTIASGGVLPYSYSWSQNTALDSASVRNLQAGQFSQTVTDANGCTAVNSYTITQPSALQLSLSDTLNHCSFTPSGIITSSAQGGTPIYQYSLLKDSIFLEGNSTGQFMQLAGGNYSVKITDSKGCTLTQNTVVSSRTPDVLTVSTVTTSCYGDEYTDGQIRLSVLSSANAPYRISIDGGNSFSSDSVFGLLRAGTYTIVARNRYGCDTTFSVQVQEPAPTTAYILPYADTIEIGNGLQLSAEIVPAQENAVYHWSPSDGLSCDDCQNPVFSGYEKVNNYSVTITYNDICTATAKSAVVVTGEGAVYIPDAFSPNGDGNNDYFEIYGKVVKSANIKIFNRWGEKVYDSQGNAFKGWDGYYKGELQPPMVYIYEAEIEFLNGKKKRQMGSLSLIR